MKLLQIKYLVRFLVFQKPYRDAVSKIHYFLFSQVSPQGSNT